MKKYKNFCCVIGLLILSNISYSQFHIGPSLGINHHYVEADENSIDFQLVNTFEPDIAIGIKTELKFRQNLFFSMLNTYSRNKIEAGDRGLVPLTSIEYSSINTNLLVNKRIYSNFAIGIGVNYIFTPSIERIYSNNSSLIGFENRNDIGFSLFLSYKYLNYALDFGYSHSLMTNKYDKNDTINMIKPITVLQLNFSYLFEIK